jgi:hypothetical protein
VSWPDPAWTTQGACRSCPDLFFPETDNLSALITARKVCVTCPVYEQCATWGLANFPHIEKGILFGYTPIERRAFWIGKLKYEDWRQTNWGSPDPQGFRRPGQVARAHAAREREARKHHVKAVEDAYNLYEIEDLEERDRVIEAYQAWQEEQNWPTTYLQARDRIDHILSKAKERGDRRPRTRALATLTRHLRPDCPDGHGPMHRVPRRATPGQDIWDCYICHIKTTTEIDEHLEMTGT